MIGTRSEIKPRLMAAGERTEAGDRHRIVPCRGTAGGPIPSLLPLVKNIFLRAEQVETHSGHKDNIAVVVYMFLRSRNIINYLTQEIYGDPSPILFKYLLKMRDRRRKLEE